MALTTTQVNAAFVALLGRAAEGNANAWAVNSADTKTLASTILSVDGSFKGSPEQAKTNEDFVEALYQTILGRPADTDAKSVWLNALASGVSREELMTQFVTAAKANNEDLSAFNNSNLAFLDGIYLKLLNRSVDDSGKATWLGLLDSGVSRAEVVAKIIDAINSNPAGEDYAIYNAKMGVANAVTAAFAGPKAGLNAEQNKALNDQLIAIMDSVASSDVKATDEGIKAQISNTVGSYGKETAPLTFHTVTTDMKTYELGNAESTTAQTFRGTINLKDPTKSTINSNANLKTSNFSDTLVVDVISDGTKPFGYSGSQVETFASNYANIKNLTINNGTAEITGLDNKGITENLKITGSANVSGSVTETLQYLEINTGGKANAEANITVSGAALTEYVGKGLGKDNITVQTGGSLSKVDTGAGDDKVVAKAGTIASGAEIKLGTGDDTIELGRVTTKATIDGGAGTDTLTLSGDASGVSFTGFEKITTSSSSDKVTLKAFNDNLASVKGVELSGNTHALTIDASGESTISIGNKISLASGATTKITVDNVGKGATVTLKADDKISETIKLANTAESVTINGFVKGVSDDKLDLSTIDASLAASVVSSGVQAVTSSASTTLDATKVTTIIAAASDLTVDTNVKLGSGSGQIKDSGLSNNTSYLIAIKANDGSKTAIYIANPGSDTTLTKGEITLIATVNGDLTADTNWLA